MYFKKVKRIKSIGKRNTYDVNVPSYSNFILNNGIVTHNSGKSSASMMIAREWCKNLGIKFHPRKHIAYSNADVMRLIDELPPFSPILADESVKFASGCLTGDTKINIIENDIMKEIEIEKLEDMKNFKVLSCDENNNLEIQTAETCVMSGEKQVYEIELENGFKIKATENHRFLTNNGWKLLKDLNIHKDKFYIIRKPHLEKIKSIKKLNIQKTYDIINVNKNHNYIINSSIVSKNSDWAKKENKLLKTKLAQVRTKHFLFILCWPLKLTRMESNFLHSFINYYIELYQRGKGVVFIRDMNPISDPWKFKDFLRLGSYTEFTEPSMVLKILSKHPNYWTSINIPKPPEWLYKSYLTVREKNVYNEGDVLSNVGKEDIHKALMLLVLRDIMVHEDIYGMNRILLHIKNEYNINLKKEDIQAAIEDSKMLYQKIKEKAIDLETVERKEITAEKKELQKDIDEN